MSETNFSNSNMNNSKWNSFKKVYYEIQKLSAIKVFAISKSFSVCIS